VGPKSALLLVTGLIDLTPPDAPANLRVTEEANDQVSLSWNPVSGAAGYNLYRSPLSGGGWVSVGAGLPDTSYTDTGLFAGVTYYYIVTASDGTGNESGYSNEVSALPQYTIGWANLQWPPTLTHTISPFNRTDDVYGQVWIDGVTNQPGPTSGLIAQVGFGPEASNPDGNPDWVWEDAAFNVDAGNNDEFKASLLPETTGTFDYLYRYSTTNGSNWLYADLNGPVPAGGLPANPGKLTVVASGDSTPPAAPTGLTVESASPAAVSLSWDPHPDTDGDLAGFEVYRDGGLLATVADSSATSFTDTAVTENANYSYYLLAFDDSFNRSGPSNTVNATATPRTVSVTFNVTVPEWTPDGSTVYIAGLLDRLDGGLPQWDPGGVSLTQDGPTSWSITLTGAESTQIAYKYTLGTWETVEKDASCGEIADRQLTLSYGEDGSQVVNDTVPNWRNVAPCGN
jgi:fibronectin type 3 domain-containing protein